MFASGPILAHETSTPDMATLSAIKLREDATKPEVREYIQRILLASRGQRSYYRTDPQIGKLIEVGPGHIDLLIEVAQDNYGWSLYPVMAIEHLASDVHKRMILDALPRQRKLVRVVIAKGWQKDARKTLLEVMRFEEGYLPTEWIQAVASLRDPQTYTALLNYLVNGWNRHVTYKLIRHLPGIDLTRALPAAWEAALGANNRYEVHALLADTLAVGHLPAMDYAMEQLGVPAGKDRLPFNARALALRHLPRYGSNDDIRAWYRKHRQRLQFDPVDRKFKPR